MTAASSNDPRKLRDIPRDHLPPSLWTVKAMPLERYNPKELEILAARPQRLVPIPEDAGQREQKLRNLAPYKGRTPEGRRRSLANLKRSVKTMVPDQPVEPTPNVPAPQVPTALPTAPPEKIIRNGAYMRVILSREEHDIYTSVWNEFFSGDGVERFNYTEDKHDVHTIALYTALEYRCLMSQMNRPSLDVSKQLEMCRKQIQKARENLAARRSDRIDTKKGGGGGGGGSTTINVAVLAGMVPTHQVDATQQIDLVKQLEAEEAEFFQNMKPPSYLGKSGREEDPIIDGEYRVKEQEDDGESIP